MKRKKNFCIICSLQILNKGSNAIYCSKCAEQKNTERKNTLKYYEGQAKYWKRKVKELKNKKKERLR